MHRVEGNREKHEKEKLTEEVQTRTNYLKDAESTLYYLGNEYPNGSKWFHDRLHRAFARNAGVKDEKSVSELLAKGEYVVKEVEALYALRKYRAMKTRYYDDK